MENVSYKLEETKWSQDLEMDKAWLSFILRSISQANSLSIFLKLQLPMGCSLEDTPIGAVLSAPWIKVTEDAGLLKREGLPIWLNLVSHCHVRIYRIAHTCILCICFFYQLERRKVTGDLVCKRLDNVEMLQSQTQQIYQLLFFQNLCYHLAVWNIQNTSMFVAFLFLYWNIALCLLSGAKNEAPLDHLCLQKDMLTECFLDMIQWEVLPNNSGCCCVLNSFNSSVRAVHIPAFCPSSLLGSLHRFHKLHCRMFSSAAERHYK